MGDTEKGQRYGQVALRLAEKYGVDAWIGRVATLYFASIQNWSRPFHESLEPMRTARQISLASGDIEFGMINGNLSCFLEMDLVPIPKIVDTIRDYQETMTRYGQAVNLQMLQPTLSILLACSGESHGDFSMLEEAENRFKDVKISDSLLVLWYHYARMVAAYLFDDMDQASCEAQHCAKIVNKPAGSGDIAMPVLIDGLLTLEKCRRHWWNLAILLPRARRRICQLRRFASCSPVNFLGKLHLLRAEMASVLGRRNAAYMNYTSAIVLMRDAGFFLQLGLANELAGKHFLRLGDFQKADPFLREAVRVYRAWGGTAKADHLMAQVSDPRYKT